MKVTVISVVFYAALAFPAYAEDVQPATDQPSVQSQLNQPGKDFEKARKLIKKQMETPSWNWDEYDCGTFPEDEISLLIDEYRAAWNPEAPGSFRRLVASIDLGSQT